MTETGNKPSAVSYFLAAWGTLRADSPGRYNIQMSQNDAYEPHHDGFKNDLYYTSTTRLLYTVLLHKTGRLAGACHTSIQLSAKTFS
jgi:hypothetical protein